MNSSPLFGRLLLALAMLAASSTMSPGWAQLAYVTNSGSGTVSVIDTATSTVTGTITLGGPAIDFLDEGNYAGAGPFALSPDGTLAYVLTSGFLSVVSITTGQYLANYPISANAIAVTPDGRRAYLSGLGTTSVTVLDLASLTVMTTIPVAGLSIAISTDGKTAYIGGLYAATVIDIETNTVTAAIGLGTAVGWGIAITPDGSALYVAGGSAETVTVVATATNSVTAVIPTDGEAQTVKITPDGTRAYVANPFASIFVIDTATLKIIDTIAAEYGQPNDLAITKDGKTVLVTCSVTPPGPGGAVIEIDTATDTVKGASLIGDEPLFIALTADGLHGVTAGISPVLTVFDATTYSVEGAVPVVSVPAGIAVTNDGTRAFVTDYLLGVVYDIDTVAQTVLGEIPVGNSPQSVAFTPDGAKAYVANSYDNTVSVLDVANGEVVAVIPVLDTPEDVKVTLDGAWAYVADADAYAVSVIETATDKVVATLSVGGPPNQLVMSPDGKTAYFSANGPDGNGPGGVWAIDLATNSVTQVFLTGSTADITRSVAITPDGSTVFAVGVGTVYPYNLVTHTAGAKISALSLFPIGVGVTSDGSKLYVSNAFETAGATFLSVLDLATGNGQSTITVGYAPWGVAMGVVPSPLAAAVLPGGRSVSLSNTATVFAAIANSGTSDLSGCAIGLPLSAPQGLSLSYQTTDPSTNTLTGTLNVPASIAANSYQTFLLSFTSSQALVDPAQALNFFCAGVTSAPVTTGVNTVDLSFSESPVADIIALAATPTNDGIVVVPNGGAAAFAVASVNAGAAAQLAASVDTGTVTLPVSATICESDAGNGQCLGPPASSVSLDIAGNATPTFSIFLQATGAIPLAPNASRVFVRFKDASGGLHGSTSVAIQTQ